MNLLSTSRAARRGNLSLRSLVALLCIVLIVGAAQLIHTHAAGDDAANSGCSLCAVAHSAAVAVPVSASPVVAGSVQTIRAAEPARAPARYFASVLSVRPPPALTPHAA